MSANVDLVRSIYAACERGDFSGFLDSSAWAHPEIQWVITEGPGTGAWTGPAGMSTSVRGMLDAWADFRIVADDTREVDAERVLAFFHFCGRGKTSGLNLEGMRTEGASVWHFGDGRVTRIVTTTTATARSPTSGSRRRPARPARSRFCCGGDPQAKAWLVVPEKPARSGDTSPRGLGER